MEEKITEENMAENVKNYWVDIWKDGRLALILFVLSLLSVIVLKAYSEHFAMIVFLGVCVILTAISLCLLIDSIRYKRPFQDIYSSFLLFLICCGFCYLIYNGYRQLE